MRSNLLIALACSGLVVALPLEAQQRADTSPNPPQKSEHRTISPMGRAMAELLRQATAHATNATNPASASAASTPRVADANANAPMATTEAQSVSASRPTGEIAVQPPL